MIVTHLSSNLSRHLILCSFFILWVFYIFLYPSLSYNPQIFAEQGSNYLFYAYNKTFAQNIWKDDAGYLVWLPRVIALLVSAIASPYWFIVLCNLIALALSSFFVSFINHPSLRSLLSSDVQRFWLGLILGLCVLPCYEVFTYINFSYIGFIFVTLLLFADKEHMHTAEYIAYFVLAALLCISKFHFVLFAPIFIFFIIVHHRHRQRRSMYFYIPALCTIMIQLFYVVLTMKYTDSVANSYTMAGLGMKGMIITLLRGVLLWFTAYSTHFRFLHHIIAVHLAGMILLCGFSYFVIVSWKKREISTSIFMAVILLNLIALGFAIISSLNQFSGIKSIFLYNAPYSFGRQGFMVYIMIWLSVAVFLLNVLQVPCLLGRQGKNIFLLMMTVLSLCTVLPKMFSIDSPSKGLSDWKNLHVLLKNPQYYIPVNPPGWGLQLGISKGISFYRIYEATAGVLDISDLSALKKKVAAVIVEYPTQERLHAFSYDESGQVISRSNMISHINSRYKYLLFETVLPGGFADKIVILNENNVPEENILMSAVYIFE